MSKSLGNFKLVHDLKKQYSGAVLRLTLLSAHYRQPLDWSEDKLHQNAKLVEKLKRKMADMNDIPADNTADIPADIMDALCDDLNTPKIMAALNAMIKAPTSPALKTQIEATLTLLGVLDNGEWTGDNDDKNENSNSTNAIDSSAIDALLAERTEAKSNKDYARADAIRAELAAQGIEIVDTAEGVSWRAK